MSEKALELLGKRRKQVKVVLITIILGLIFLGCFRPAPGMAQQGNAAGPAANKEATNCVVVSTTTSCTEASVNFGTSSVSVCGLPITVSTSLTNQAGLIVTETSYTNATNAKTNICANTFTTNKPAPIIISKTWTDSSSTNSGSGLSASFRPTAQSGFVTFSVVWKHICDGNTSTNSTSVSYYVPCPTITNCTVLNNCAPSGLYGALIGYNFKCADGWYSWELITKDSDTCGAGNIVSATSADLWDWSKGDQIYNGGTPSSSCTTVTSQTFYFALVGGGSTTNNNSVCSFNNTQTITVTQTNAPSTPPHGIITTTVTIGGGASAICTY